MENSVTLPVNGLHEESYSIKRWHVQIPNEHKAEDIVKPSYWAHISRRLHRGDIITGTKEDNSTFYELLVIEPLKTSTVVRLLREVNLEEELHEAETITKETIKQFEAKWISPNNKWGVVRKKDNVTIIENLATKDDANKYIHDRWKDHI
jgi:hypothetical protein